MTEQHLIIPSPELVTQWVDAWYDAKVKHNELVEFVATQAARWGADQELEACCEWMESWFGIGSGQTAQNLRAARRPKPPSLKARALQAMDRVDIIWDTDEFGKETMDDINAIRRALEALPDD